MSERRFSKVLVANRGEIAVRVLRGLREMEIPSVAVYSEVDRDAVHVLEADEAVCIGPAASTASYLNIHKIIAACRERGADAVHPGYGFLSENPEFARALEEAGLVFIGPPASAIEAMGEKTRARELAVKAGVPVVPGSPGAISDDQEALALAREMGFPVLVKAAAGGGGKGMERIDSEDAFVDKLTAARRVAGAAFGDDRVYLEKYVTNPRHVEIQILADMHGNVRHLFERDCSIQRRHQKVVEETPCPVIRPEVRAAMGAVAVKAAEAVSYVGAGTVEFLMDEDQSFYFLEMNTRLQVEHPITEMITGIDLVRAQVEIAQGKPITWSQEELVPRGASIECRIYAEDPRTGFMPSPGRIVRLREPLGLGVRNDGGYVSGSEVPVHYDPLVSKLVVWAENREAAIGRMKRALADYVLLGIRHNIGFHQMVMEHPDFVSGQYSTHFIPKLVETGAALELEPDSELQEVAEIAAALHAELGIGKTQGAGMSPTSGRDHAWKRYGRWRKLGRA